MKYITLVFLLFIAGCSSTTENSEVVGNRRQLLLVPSSQILQLSDQSYAQVKAKASAEGKLDTNPELVRRLQQVAKKIAAQSSLFRKDSAEWDWEVHLITSEELNAYCMPGGKIIFYTGIIEKLNLTDAEIAAIMGHEVAHALKEHGRERMSEELVKSLGLNFLLVTNKMDAKYAGAANLLTTLTVSLPHNRNQETEADGIGLDLMARAGYDPNAAVSLWQKMAGAGGNKPPEILSSHPTDRKRIDNLQNLVPKALPLYQQASAKPNKAAG